MLFPQFLCNGITGQIGILENTFICIYIIQWETQNSTLSTICYLVADTILPTAFLRALVQENIAYKKDKNLL